MEQDTEQQISGQQSKSPRMHLQQGLLEIYCGDGKGKTTAALGLALRAAGCGLRVHIVQFLKGTETGELASLAQIPQISVCAWTARQRSGKRFYFEKTGDAGAGADRTKS